MFVESLLPFDRNPELERRALAFAAFDRRVPSRLQSRARIP